MKITYPIYTREENLRCKLSDRDITEIKEMRSKGLTYKAIGDLFGITQQAVFYWCLDNQTRKERNHKRAQVRGYIYNPVSAKKTRDRKLKIKPSMREYEKEYSKYQKDTNPNAIEWKKKTRLHEKLKGPNYRHQRYSKFIERWGKPAWAEYHRLLRLGIKKSFSEISKEIK